MTPARPTFSVLLYGDSGAGKTTQIGVLASWLMEEHRLRTRLYNADGGTPKAINDLVKAGLIEVVQCHKRPQPWVWIDAASKGKVLAEDGKTWVLDEARNALFGLYAYDGLTGFGEALLANMRDASEPQVGGGMGMVVRQGGTTFGTNTQAHYGLAQGCLIDAVGNSQTLPGISLWTATAKRTADADTLATVLGPQLPGKALTSDSPRWFQYCFRVNQTIEKGQLVYRLYWEDFDDPTAPGAKCLGNSRLPLGANTGGKSYNEPADIGEAIRLFDRLHEEAARAAQKKWGEIVAALPPLPPLPAAPAPRVVVPGRPAGPVVVGSVRK